MKIALVHDYLTQRGGAERVFELLCKQYPNADIFTSVYDRERTIDLGERLVRTSVLQNIPQGSEVFQTPGSLVFSGLSSIGSSRL